MTNSIHVHLSCSDSCGGDAQSVLGSSAGGCCGSKLCNGAEGSRSAATLSETVTDGSLKEAADGEQMLADGKVGFGFIYNFKNILIFRKIQVFVLHYG